MNTSPLLSKLLDCLGPDRVLTDEESLDRFSGDSLGVFRAFRSASKLSARPTVVVQAKLTAEISRILSLANSHRVPVVPYGAGTGLMGGAVAVDGCILLDMKRLNRIHEVKREDRTVRVDAGVVLKDLEEALNREGLILGHDPWSLPIATVGGAISTNGVGYRVAKYGSMGEQVLGLKAVLANGEVINTREAAKNSAGPSLNHLLIGSEGTLGIITEATLKVFPQPERRVLRAVEFPDFESGFGAIMKLYSLDVRPAILDFTEWPLLDSSEGQGKTILYLGSEGFRQEVEAQDRRALELCLEFGGRERESSEALRFWETRHEKGERYRREVVDNTRPGVARRMDSSHRIDFIHVALPVSRILEYRRRCVEILSSHNIAVTEWSIWGKPEFLSLQIVEREACQGEISEAMAQAVDQVLTLAQGMGGAMEYCHGVGLKLAHLMKAELGPAMDTVRQLKAALDPHNILNPGKLGI